MKRSALVIGAGIGGITTAIHLARSGMHVTVLEKNSNPGGRCDRFSRDGHYFDTGPTLLVMPLLYETEFASLGSSWREMLDLVPVDPTYHLIFDDGSKLALTSDQDEMRRQEELMRKGEFTLESFKTFGWELLVPLCTGSLIYGVLSAGLAFALTLRLIPIVHTWSIPRWPRRKRQR